MSKDYKPGFYDVLVQGPFDKRSAVDYKIIVDFDYVDNADLFIRGGMFEYYWNGKEWSNNITNLIQDIDALIYKKYTELKAQHPDATVQVGFARNNSSGIVNRFFTYCKQSQDKDASFNSKIFYDNEVPKRDDYSTFKLSYHPQKGNCPAFDELVGTLYEPEEINKIMWALGALYVGDMKYIEKFLYFYGPGGSGKGTILRIIEMLFESYVGAIALDRLTNGSEFGTSSIADVPILIDHDSKIDKIKKDTDLLKLISHENVIVRKMYQNGTPVRFNGLLVTASNTRFDARDADAGINRRALVVHPSGRKIPMLRYNMLFERIPFELPYIAQKAIDTYNSLGMDYYNNTRDEEMLRWNDTLYACIDDNILLFEQGITLNQATKIYKDYLDDLGYSTVGCKGTLRIRLGNYYHNFAKSKMIDGVRLTNYYWNFKHELIISQAHKVKPIEDTVVAEPNWLDLTEQDSLFDKEAADYPAQLTKEDGTPKYKWDTVRTTLKDINTKELHFVKVPQNHIVLDFDMKNENGEKDLELNIKEALKYPSTYAEVSKSGGGLHLHYWYDGEVTELKNLIKDDVEVKVFTGKSSLRRKLVKCNNLPIAHIATGLPLKEKDVTMYKDIEDIQWTEKKLRKFIENCMDKTHHGATKPEIDFIYSELQKAKETGVRYNLTDMYDALFKFAMRSTHNKDYCIDIVNKLPLSTYQTEEEVGNGNDVVDDKDIVFFDVEVFSNLFLICWKKNRVMVPDWVFDDLNPDDPNQLLSMESTDILKAEWYAQNKDNYGIWFNPSVNQIEYLLEFPLVGFNNRKYDNHILYNASLGASPMDLYLQSQNIINKTGDGGMKPAAYNLSYADVYEFMDTKQSLKKWEIQLGLQHDEFEFPWDQPLDKSKWIRCAKYCMHDTNATDEVFNDEDAGKPAWAARKVMCELTDMAPNTKTQTLAEKFLFGDDPRPQDNFEYYDLAREFPGYTFDPNRKPKSDYKGKDPSEGGYVSSKPGVYGVTAKDYLNGNTLDEQTGRSKLVTYIDVASLHPHSLIAINYFGKYTPKFKALVKCRMYIKHGELDKASHAFDNIDIHLSEKLAKYFKDPSMIDGFAHAMKIIINIVYGMTSAPYDNKFRDPRNVDNIVAKRGALFMMMLEEEMVERSVNVIHVKTDSMKLTNYLPEDIDYAMKRANEFGYTFEIECVYDRLALVNKAVLIGHHEGKPEHGPKTWEAVGSQFAEPFVYKKLFSHEEIEEADFMSLKAVKSAIYLGERFIGKNANVYASNTGEDLLSAREVNIAQSIQVRAQKPIEKYLPKRDYEGLSYAEQESNRVAKIAKELDLKPELVKNIIDNNFPKTNVTKYNYVTGTKGYKWGLSSEYKGKDDVDMYYYKRLVDEAVDSIYDVGDGNIIFEGTKYARA